jgi:hypothetical protein
MLGDKLMRVTTAMLAAALLASMLACAGPMQKIQQAAQRAKTQNDLKQIAIEYLNYESTNGKSPATLDEFLTFFDKALGPNPISADLRSGKYIIYLDVKLKTFRMARRTQCWATSQPSVLPVVRWSWRTEALWS